MRRYHVIYVSGPISASSEPDRQRNVRNAEAMARELYREGYVPLVPHLNTYLHLVPHHATPEFLYLSDLELLSRCDAVILCGSPSACERSFGTNLELAWARHNGIPVFTNLLELIAAFPQRRFA